MAANKLAIFVGLFAGVFFCCHGSITWGEETKICVKGKGKNPGYWAMKEAGKLKAVKMSHVGELNDSYVTCYDKGNFKSFWGCNLLWKGIRVMDYVNMHVTDLYNNPVFPRTVGKGGFYKLPNKNGLSKTIVVGSLFGPDHLEVKAGDEVKIWYGEDLYDHHAQDNGQSQTCFMASAYVTP